MKITDIVNSLTLIFMAMFITEFPPKTSIKYIVFFSFDIVHVSRIECPITVHTRVHLLYMWH